CLYRRYTAFFIRLASPVFDRRSAFLCLVFKVLIGTVHPLFY
ncbi:MAG: hypothetical protein PWP12_627, partial [Bacillota bacterium]|nr:hypothetical protein [Bacillota bacterium]MDK2960443.1 hypothetical protein [Bacillota bacterium]